MYLALTADKQFWSDGEPILFLGAWCVPPGTLPETAPVGSRLLTHPWKNRALYRADSVRLNACYESALQVLHGALNRIHGTAYEERFWRVLIGPWLYSYVYILYERWISLCAAAQNASLRTTIVPAGASWVPTDHAQFLRWVATDAYNLFLYSRIIEVTQLVPFTVKTEPRLIPPPEATTAGTKTPRLKYGRVFFMDSLLTWKDHLRLALQARLWIRRAKNPLPDPEASPDFKLRESFKDLPLSGDFEHVLKRLLPVCFPTAYLESFGSLIHRAADYLPSTTRVIITGTTLLLNETVKCAAALQQSRGAIIADVQHGGQYGLGGWNSDEEHELKIADRFYSWGGFFNTSKAVPLDAFKLIQAQNIIPAKQGAILLTLMSIPRYFHFSASVPTPADFPDYLAAIEGFVDALDGPTRQLLRIRRYSTDYGWDETKWLQNRMPDIPVAANQESIYSQMKKCRLFIGTYNATTLLEALTANIPTVFFWDPAYWEIRPDAQPLMDLLTDAGIVWSQPQRAARHVNAIASDPAAWWNQNHIQAARKQFCDRFATISPDWASHWAGELNRLLALDPQ